MHVADAGGDDSEGEAREDVGVVTLTKIFISGVVRHTYI